MWKTIQIRANNGPPVQLILDMRVQWSSTYLMLDRAERKKDVCSKFQMKDQYSLFVLCSVLMLLSMSFDGKNKTLPNVIRFMNSSSRVGYGMGAGDPYWSRVWVRVVCPVPATCPQQRACCEVTIYTEQSWAGTPSSQTPTIIMMVLCSTTSLRK